MHWYNSYNIYLALNLPKLLTPEAMFQHLYGTLLIIFQIDILSLSSI
jgi:hypothetical protein